MRKLWLSIWTATAAVTLSTAGLAQGLDTVTKRGHVGGVDGSVEVAPLNLLLNAAPGVGSAGIAGELKISEHTALMAEGAFLNANVPQKTLNRAKTDLKPDSLKGYSTAVGVQTYATPHMSSWYYGGKVGYMATKGKWDYKGSTIDHESKAIVPAVMGGYRWLYDNNMTLRLGATAGPHLLQSKKIAARDNTANAATGVKKLNDFEKRPVQAQVDFLIGYAF